MTRMRREVNRDKTFISSIRDAVSERDLMR